MLTCKRLKQCILISLLFLLTQLHFSGLNTSFCFFMFSSVIILIEHPLGFLHNRFSTTALKSANPCFILLSPIDWRLNYTFHIVNRCKIKTGNCFWAITKVARTQELLKVSINGKSCTIGSFQNRCFHPFQDGNYEEALSKFLVSMQVQGFKPYLAYNIALCYYRLKDYTLSLKYCGEFYFLLDHHLKPTIYSRYNRKWHKRSSRNEHRNANWRDRSEICWKYANITWNCADGGIQLEGSDWIPIQE